MSNKMILASVAFVISLGASAPVFAQGQGVVPQDESGRAIPSPADLVPLQLGIVPPLPIQEGRSVAIVPPVLVPVAPTYPQGVEPAIPGAGEPDR